MGIYDLESNDSPQSLSLSNDPSAADHFRAAVLHLTPQLYVAGILVAINLLIFALMALTGAGFFQPTVAGLIRWGANYGPRTTNGEWWRLVTCTYVHVGLLHLLFNMFTLAQIGPLMERLLGNIGFLVLYTVAGVAGSFASVIWNPQITSAGASGAIFGLYGALLGLLVLQPKGIPSEVLSPLAKGALGFIGYNIVYGLAQQGIDMAAHLGGLVSGFLCGMALSVPFTPEGASRRDRRAALLAAVSIAVFFFTAARTPRAADFLEAIQHFGTVEEKTIAAYNDALRKFQTGSLKAPEFAALLDHDLLPAWKVEKQNLSNVKDLPYRQRHLRNLLVEYADLRTTAWSTLVSGLRSNNLSLVKEAFEKQREAAAAAKEIARFAGSKK